MDSWTICFVSPNPSGNEFILLLQSHNPPGHRNLRFFKSNLGARTQTPTQMTTDVPSYSRPQLSFNQPGHHTRDCFRHAMLC